TRLSSDLAEDVDESVADVDEKFKGQGEAVAEQPGGDEDGFRAIVRDVPMADSLVAEFGGVGRGYQCGFAAAAVAEGEWNEVVGFTGQRAGDGDGDGLDHTVEVIAWEVVVAECGVTYTVCRMTHGRF